MSHRPGPMEKHIKKRLPDYNAEVSPKTNAERLNMRQGNKLPLSTRPITVFAVMVS